MVHERQACVEVEIAARDGRQGVDRARGAANDALERVLAGGRSVAAPEPGPVGAGPRRSMCVGEGGVLYLGLASGWRSRMRWKTKRGSVLWAERLLPLLPSTTGDAAFVFLEVRF